MSTDRDLAVLSKLSASQQMVAERLSSMAIDRCEMVGLRPKNCKPRHFATIVLDLGDYTSGMISKLKDCIDWCVANDKRMFTAARFRNWIKNDIKWAKERQINEYEKNKLKNGNEYQKAQFSRQFSPH